jgi:hypothetical protein
MSKTRDWQGMRDMSVRLLKERTGQDIEAWNRRIEEEGLEDEKSLRKWLAKQAVTGPVQSLLVIERFGSPDFLLATGEELIDGQYADRPHLRPIFDAVIAAATGLGEVVIQARTTSVSLLSPRRTFALIQATAPDRVDLCLRLEGLKPEGRLQPSTIDETMPLQVSLKSRDELDSEALAWLQQAYVENS